MSPRTVRVLATTPWSTYEHETRGFRVCRRCAAGSLQQARRYGYRTRRDHHTRGSSAPTCRNSATRGCSAAARRNTARRYQARGTATFQLVSAERSKGVPLQRRIDVVAKGIERQRRCLGGGASLRSASVRPPCVIRDCFHGGAYLDRDLAMRQKLEITPVTNGLRHDAILVRDIDGDRLSGETSNVVWAERLAPDREELPKREQRGRGSFNVNLYRFYTCSR